MLQSPYYLLLLLLLPWLGWRLFRPQSSGAFQISSTQNLSGLKPTLRQRLMWLPPALTVLALVLLVVGLARPREGREQTITEGEGIAIQFVVDKSGSMEAMDFQVEGQSVDRLTAIKNVVNKFVNGGDGLEGRISDLTGLITFARFADSQTPLTLDHTFFMSALNQTRIVREQAESGTAIGDALALAVEKLDGMERGEGDQVESRIIILLTDGENNIGEMQPLQAAELAKALGIRVYTIGVGSNGEIAVPTIDPLTGREVVRWAMVSIDEETLTAVADMTGGKYFRATDTDSLEQIYSEIDQLEKSKVETRHYVDYREMAVQATQYKFLKLPAILWGAYGLLALRVALEMTWLRYGV